MLLGLYGLAHHIRASSHENGYPFQPRVRIAYFFTSHDHIHHVRIFWGTLPLLLFSDPRMVHPVDVYRFQGQAVHRMHQQHIQLGLRKGMAVLVYYRVQSGPHVNEVFQAVLIAHESARLVFGSAYCIGSVHLGRTSGLSYQWSL